MSIPAQIKRAKDVVVSYVPPSLFSSAMQTALVFAARYSHDRNTGAATMVIRALRESWSRLEQHNRVQILRETREAVYNTHEWQEFRAWAEAHLQDEIAQAADSRTTERKILDFAEQHWGEKSLSAIAARLAEECGEVAGAIIKEEEGRKTPRDLLNEIGDVLIVLSQLAAKRGMTLEDIREERFNYIQRRNNEKSNGKHSAGADLVSV